MDNKDTHRMNAAELENEDPLLVERAVFGRQVEEFMSSPVGQYMLKRAEDKMQAAFARFATISPENSEEVKACQREYLLAADIKGWLADAVQDGLQALNLLEDRG